MEILGHKHKLSSILSATIFVLSSVMSTPSAIANQDEHVDNITLIHLGDLHGQIESHGNLRSDNKNKDLEGGLARVYTKMKAIRNKAENQNQTHWTLMVGDTTHGSAEATYTQGDIILKIVNSFGIDLFAPGNWDFIYGTCRTHEMWNFNEDAIAALNAKPQLNCTIPTQASRLRANFKAISSNAYVDNNRNSENCPPTGERTRLFDSYEILHDPKTGLNIGVIAFTTERGPRAIGHPVVEGMCFTKGDEEIVEMVSLMNDKRTAGQIHAVVMISELNLANSRRVINLVDEALEAGGVDLVLSADMHEETPKIIYTDNGTPMIAQGQDGQNIGEISLKFKNTILVKIDYKAHPIEEKVKEDPDVAGLVAQLRDPFINGTATDSHFVHGHKIPRDIIDPNKSLGIEAPLAVAGMDINRSNFTDEESAAIYEGSGHSLITDGMRESVIKILAKKMTAGQLDAQSAAADLCSDHNVSGACIAHLPVIAVIRGFRYTSSTRQGEPVTLETLYHYVPIGPYAAVGIVTGAQIRGKGTFEDSTSPSRNGHMNAGGIENSVFSALRPDVRNWGGGWLFNWSGLKYDLNPYGDMDNHISNVMIGTDVEGFAALDDTKSYIVVGYSFDKVLFGIESPVPELQFINKPFKARFVTPNIYRVTYASDDKSTLDPSNELDLVSTPFTVSRGANNSIPVVDLVARYIMTEFAAKDKAVKLVEPAQRVKVLCSLPNMAAVTHTENQATIDLNHPIIDIGFPMMQSIFGANKNLAEYLSSHQRKECIDNGIL